MYVKSQNRSLMWKTRAKCEIKKLKGIISKLEEKIRVLEGKSSNLFKQKKMSRWCDHFTTVKTCRLKLPCGLTSYKNFLRQSHPLPSFCESGNSKLENWKFASGNCDAIFEFLKTKVSQLKHDHERDCLLIIEEIGITPKLCHDDASGAMIGNVTLPGHDDKERATHAVVFVLAGISKRWRQSIDYFFTGKSIDGSVYRSLIVNYVRKANSVGLDVHGVVSDIGSANQCMWRTFGISAHRYSAIITKCPHPVDDNRFLYFFHNATRDFENLRQGKFNDDTDIIIPPSFVEKYQLKTNFTSAKHLQDSFRSQNSVDATSRLSGTSGGLESLTGSFLVAQFGKWLKVMTCESTGAKHDENFDFLRGFVELVSSLKFEKGPEWKLFQKGIILSTTSYVELASFLSNARGYGFVAGRTFTWDCLFAISPVKNCTLDALQLRNHLKLTTLSQYLQQVSSDRKENDRDFLPDFLQTTLENGPITVRNGPPATTAPHGMHYNPKAKYHDVSLDNFEVHSLHSIADRVVESILRIDGACNFCLACTGRFKWRLSSRGKLPQRFAGELSFSVNQRAFNFFVEMEKMFRGTLKGVKSVSPLNLRRTLVTKFLAIPYILPDCHRLKSEIVRRFVMFRMKMYMKKNKHAIGTR
ncbi:uncharacterized protein LOC106646201 [Copidosoma floridanum]|uniref:uncharacterized protein LOC106646201 n=1 Tax=Copidosoma floridanum TaxID=29053 RepID=UPI0006C9841C|nr:uncharacterized protein LOC106646201 [Copidosoma floridanum]